MGDRRRAARAGLRVIDGGGAAAGGAVPFCSHCGSDAAETPRSELGQVCEFCSIGVIFEAHPAVVPRREPFLVVDSVLKIVTVSDDAERLLGVYEQDARGRAVTRYLIVDDHRQATGLNFVVAISDACTGNGAQGAIARLRTRPEIPLQLRIATFARPRSALVVFAGEADTDGDRGTWPGRLPGYTRGPS
jgi:hypothetical protein